MISPVLWCCDTLRWNEKCQAYARSWSAGSADIVVWRMDIFFMAAAAFDSDKDNNMQWFCTVRRSGHREPRPVQNWQDWSDRSSGLCATLPTRPPGDPQPAAVPQSAALRSSACAPVLHWICNPVVSLLNYTTKSAAVAVAWNSLLDVCASRLAVSANFMLSSLVVSANFIWI